MRLIEVVTPGPRPWRQEQSLTIDQANDRGNAAWKYVNGSLVSTPNSKLPSTPNRQIANVNSNANRLGQGLGDLELGFRWIWGRGLLGSGAWSLGFDVRADG